MKKQAESTINSALDVNCAIASSSLDQVSAKSYLQQKVFPKLEAALNNVSVT